MRGLLLAGVFLIATIPQCPAEEFHALRLRDAMMVRHAAGDLPTRTEPFRPQDTNNPAIMQIGPIEARMIGGHAHYELAGVRVLGGGVSGTIDGHGAKIFLRWPNN